MMPASYDNWLERPYQERAAEEDAYMDWCEVRGIDPDKAISEDFYLDWLEGGDDPVVDDEPYEEWGFGD